MAAQIADNFMFPEQKETSKGKRKSPKFQNNTKGNHFREKVTGAY